MKYLQNLHTHSTFCDGKDTPERMVQYALDKGFSSLGFSGHSYTDFYHYCMTEEGTEVYKKEIAALKKKYADRIAIYCGLESDLYSTDDRTGFDYVIGSVHSVRLADGTIAEFDHTADEVRRLIQNYFDGDAMKLVRCYYEKVVEMAECRSIDFVGHFDLVSKHCEKEKLFDMDAPQYRKYALEALDAVADRIKLFEMNSGAIARGYRSTPYPAPFILKAMKEKGCGIILTSDCHDGSFLDCHFTEMAELLKQAGFRERYILTTHGFEAIGIDE